MLRPRGVCARENPADGGGGVSGPRQPEFGPQGPPLRPDRGSSPRRPSWARPDSIRGSEQRRHAGPARPGRRGPRGPLTWAPPAGRDSERVAPLPVASGPGPGRRRPSPPVRRVPPRRRGDSASRGCTMAAIVQPRDGWQPSFHPHDTPSLCQHIKIRTLAGRKPPLPPPLPPPWPPWHSRSPSPRGGPRPSAGPSGPAEGRGVGACGVPGPVAMLR